AFQPARAERFGRMAVSATVLGSLLHLASLALRGLAAGRVPWGNMYEFGSLLCLAAVTTWLVLLRRGAPVRRLGGFVLLPIRRLGDLRGLPALARDGRLAGHPGRGDQRARLRGHGVQPVLHQPGRGRAALLRRGRLSPVSRATRGNDYRRGRECGR